MNFKQIKDKAIYLEEHYIFEDVPSLTDKKHCVHCDEDFIVGDYKVIRENGEEFIVCPNAPKCDGRLIDWINATN